ncbi:MAG: hypothetical protein COV76_02130, partial [Candidatus Omnitrophica bacterium CG11_big_fil_rev_8_21_14_0_20_64_10]
MNLYSVSSLVAAIFCWGLALFVYLRSNRASERLFFAAVTFLIGIWTFFPYLTSQTTDPNLALTQTRLLYIAAMFVPFLFYKFMIHTMGIEQEPAVRRISKFSLGAAFFFPLFFSSPLFIRDLISIPPHVVIQPGPIYPVFVLYFGLMYFDASLRLLRLYQQATGHFKEHLKYIGLAFVMAFCAGLMHFASAYSIRELFPHDFLVIGYSGIIAYAIIRYRIMDFRVAIARTVILAGIYTLLLGVPLIFFTTQSQEIIRLVQNRPWMIPLGLAGYAILASCVPFLYLALQRRAEARLLAESHRYQAVLRQASYGMTLIKELHKLLNLIVHLLTQKVRIRHASVYLLDETKKNFALKVSRQWHVETSPVFP